MQSGTILRAAWDGLVGLGQRERGEAACARGFEEADSGCDRYSNACWCRARPLMARCRDGWRSGRWAR